MSLLDHTRSHQKVNFIGYHDGEKRIEHGDAANFVQYRKGVLTYKDGTLDKVERFTVPQDKGYLIYRTETGITFEVPISDIGDATFLATDSANLFRRYLHDAVKKHEATNV